MQPMRKWADTLSTLGESIGPAGVIILLVLFMLGMPVSFAMAFVGFEYLVGWEAAVSLLIRDIFFQMSKNSLNVIFSFVLMGSLAFAIGTSSRLYIQHIRPLEKCRQDRRLLLYRLVAALL